MPSKGKKQKSASRDEHGLTPKQRAWADAYLVHGNGTQASRDAGYKGSDVTLGQVAAENLKKPKIIAYLQERQKKIHDKYEVTQERIVAELARIGFADIGEVASWSEDGVVFVSSEDLEEDQTAAIKSVSSVRTVTSGSDGETITERVNLKVDMHSKLEALDKLGRHLKMFTDKHEITGADGQPFEVRWADEDEEQKG